MFVKFSMFQVWKMYFSNQGLVEWICGGDDIGETVVSSGCYMNERDRATNMI